MCEKYNGWSNYETWVVNLWITNEESSDTYWRVAARRLLRDLLAENAIYELSKQLQEEIEAGDPTPEYGLYTDLIRAALKDINYYEIAEHFVNDC